MILLRFVMIHELFYIAGKVNCVFPRSLRKLLPFKETLRSFYMGARLLPGDSDWKENHFFNESL